MNSLPEQIQNEIYKYKHQLEYIPIVNELKDLRIKCSIIYVDMYSTEEYDIEEKICSRSICILFHIKRLKIIKRHGKYNKKYNKK